MASGSLAKDCKPVTYLKKNMAHGRNHTFLSASMWFEPLPYIVLALWQFYLHGCRKQTLEGHLGIFLLQDNNKATFILLQDNNKQHSYCYKTTTKQHSYLLKDNKTFLCVSSTNKFLVSILPLTTLGKGHLACVTFSGGKAYPRRKYVMVSGHGADEARNVKADINFLSYYNKARTGANESATQEGKDIYNVWLNNLINFKFFVVIQRVLQWLRKNILEEMHRGNL